MKRLLWAALLSAALHAAVLALAPGKPLQPPTLSGSRASIMVSLASYPDAGGQAAAPAKPEPAPVAEPISPPPRPKPEPPPPAARAASTPAPPKTPPAASPSESAPREAVKAEPPAVQPEAPGQATEKPAGEPQASAAPKGESAVQLPDDIQTSGPPAAAGSILRPAVPLYRRNPPPPYPRIAKARGYQGKTLLNVLVGRDGRAEEVTVAASSGYRLLDEAAVKAVGEWIFEPAKRGPEAVAMWVKVPIRFRIR